ncbi:MAG TPA: YciI family protein [Longimicrobiaceae bacterium]|nr:YciI family protein [Longimicrobiaceae bacterium]
MSPQVLTLSFTRKIMVRLIVLFGLVGAFATLPRVLHAQTSGSPAILPVPTAWDTVYILALSRGPAYPTGQSTPEQLSVLEQHIQYQLRLQAEGKALAAGPVSPLPGDSTLGLTLLRVRSRSEAEALVAGDPGVRSGRFNFSLRAWIIPRERLP